MEANIDLQDYLTRGVEKVVADSLRATLRHPKESTFMLRFAAASRKASRRRAALEKEGEHIPTFIMASITSNCNLHCAGCYSRCTKATLDEKPVEQLSAAEWEKIFREAADIGVSYILLAGGEPLLRRDVIEAAGGIPSILFPIFTNGVFLDERYFDLLDRCRNLLPVMSLEGGREATDARRSPGVYDKIMANMEELQRRGLFFGAAVTVTSANFGEVFSAPFIDSLSERGCAALIYIEYVPVTEESRELAVSEEQQEEMRSAINRLREEYPEIVFISFPGDEKEAGGCIAAGRGFFHINSHGGAEPCPFSPYSDMSVARTSIRQALNSPLFAALRQGDLMADDHVGGCALYERREQVEALLAALQK
ncbi:MAG: radical SAM protein [Firmicutes bacterium]|nr:radical SAM protein [Bacillota bacterium]